METQVNGNGDREPAGAMPSEFTGTAVAFDAIFHQAAVGIAAVGWDGSWLQVNDRLCEIVGYPADELRQLTFQDITHPDDLDLDLGLLEQLITSEITTCVFEKRYLHKRGHAVWARLTVSTVPRPDGSPDYFVISVEDISQTKQLEKAVEQTQKLDAMGRLVGGIAHEFNNKLSAITANLFLASAHPDDYKDYVQQADDLCFQAAEVVKSLLAYAREEPIERQHLSLLVLMQQAREELRMLVPPTVHLEFALSDDPLEMNANGVQIKQIVVNLLNNAVDAVQDSADARVTVHLDRVEAVPDMVPVISAGHHGPWAELVVEDNGPGIPSRYLDKIFDPFFTTKPVGRGTGLGLALVTSLVDQHQGAIDVESKSTGGAAFRLYFPLLADPSFVQEAPPDDSVQGLSEGDGERILVVDDDVSVLRPMAALIATLGYEVDRASGGQEALERYAEAGGDYSCVLSDVMMPGINGVELCRRLKALDPDLPMVLMTGREPVEDVSDIDVEVLHKPITPARLSAVIHDRIASRHRS